MPASAILEPPPTLLTAEEFVDFCGRPENANRRFELDRGKVVEMPLPNIIHGTLCSNIAAELVIYSRKRRKGFVATNDTGVLLGREPDTVRGPDVALFEDVARYRDLRPKLHETPPVLAVEVLSPSDTYKAVNLKIKQYLLAGVKVIWVVDCDEKSVSIFRPDGNWSTVTVDEEIVGEPELPGFRCRVSDLFLLPEELPEPPLS
jgi:Uma2 family endonuclease